MFIMMRLMIVSILFRGRLFKKDWYRYNLTRYLDYAYIKLYN